MKPVLNYIPVKIGLFEALEYKVVRLDRVQFASLTKKDLPRGMFRHLTEQEVSFLKMSS
jgi:23S rRNA pseudouridine2605 synthase